MIATRWLPFSPLFIGEVNVTNYSKNTIKFYIVTFSPLFIGEVNVTKKTPNNAKWLLSLSVPYSSGK